MSDLLMLSRIALGFALMFLASSCGSLDDNFCPGIDCTTTVCENVTYSTLHSDDFNRADGAIGSNYTVVEDVGTTIEIKSLVVDLGRYNITGLTPVGYYISGASDSCTRLSGLFAITGNNVNGGSGTFGLIARAQSTSSSENSYICQIDTLSTQQLQIFKSSTNPEILASSTSTAPLANGDSYQMTFTLEGNSLTCVVTGSASMSVSVSDSEFSNGYHGFTGGIENFVEITVDNFLFEVGY